ncbi:MAG: hypothetical protein IKI58_09005 [Oscillospiraceae bacterium]|nr:hypothetical protein [Oscillospiraceae bacterium]
MFITCPQCGYQLVRPEEGRCTVCGYRLGTAPQPKQKQPKAWRIAAGIGAVLLVAACVMIAADLLRGGSGGKTNDSSSTAGIAQVQNDSSAAELTVPPVSSSTTGTVSLTAAQTTTAAPVTTAPAPADPEGYLALYQPAVEQALRDYGQPVYNETSWNDGAFIRLYDFDNDGISELYLTGFPAWERSGMGEIKVYTVVNGAAKEIFQYRQFPLTTVDTSESLLRDSRTGKLNIYEITCDGLVPGYYGDYISTWCKNGDSFIQNSAYLLMLDTTYNNPAPGTKVGGYTVIGNISETEYDWETGPDDPFGKEYGAHCNKGQEEYQITLDAIRRIREARMQ